LGRTLDIKLPFRIEGKIDIKAVRSKAGRKAAFEQLRAEAGTAPAAAQPHEPVPSPVSSYVEVVA
jgi:hypothetical protein